MGYDGIFIQLVQASDDGMGRCQEYAPILRIRPWFSRRECHQCEDGDYKEGQKGHFVQARRWHSRFVFQVSFAERDILLSRTVTTDVSGDDIVPHAFGRTLTPVSVYLVTVEGKYKRSPDFSATSCFCGRFAMISDAMVLKRNC